jgi:peptide/nickel transport system permease protein
LIPVAIGIVTITFALGNLIPTDPIRVAVGPRASQETVEKVRAQFGLDKPLPQQYVIYWQRLLAGDMGTSVVTRRPVTEDLKRRIPATLELAVAATLMGVTSGIILGVVSAVHKGRLPDQVSRVVAIGGVSSPDFFTGMLLQLILASGLGLLPITGRIDPGIELTKITGLYLVDSVLTGNWVALVSAAKHILLPAATLALPFSAMVARLTSSGMLDVLNKDYILNARVAAGLPERLVVYKYAVKNALVGTTSQIALNIGWLLGGAVIVEKVFDWQGLGLFVVQAALNDDLRPIMATTLVAGVTYVIINAVADLTYTFLDPRISI